jgi:glycolate oxidase FAD binding subunit
MTPSIRQELATLVPAETLLPEGRGEGWPRDVPHPSVCLEPEHEEEVALILERASREGWRVYPSGAGSWLHGRGAPEVDILLSTRRLQAMEIYDPADLTFTAGAGILFGELQEATRANGQWLPLDPPAAQKGSLGGLVSTGVSGPLRHAYGSPRDHILGLTMVTGDGRLLRWGGRVVKNVAGFDVTRLTIGSWGTLGVITSVSARLFPLPEEDRTLLFTGPSAEALLPAARQIALSSLPFSTAELIDPLDSSRAEAGLALRLLGTQAHVDELEARGREELSGWAAAERGVVTLESEESRRFHETQGCWEEGAPLVLRLSLLPSKMEWLMTRSRALLEEMGSESEGRVALHLGWGVLRIAFDELPSEGKAMTGIGQLLSTLRSELEEKGGSLILSEGPRGLLRSVGPWGSLGTEAGLVAGLKREFDPKGILAPGRITD